MRIKRSPHELVLYSLSIILAIAPFVAGLIRVTEARDFRLLWMAAAAFAGAMLIRVMGKRRSGQPRARLARSAATLAAAALLAATTAYLLGARGVPGVSAVAIVMGLFLAASDALHALSRPNTI